jgi:hypothetical protein
MSYKIVQRTHKIKEDRPSRGQGMREWSPRGAPTKQSEYWQHCQPGWPTVAGHAWDRWQPGAVWEAGLPT